MAIPVKEILMVAKFLGSKEGKELTNSLKSASSPAGKGSGSSGTGDGSRGDDEVLNRLKTVMIGSPADYVIRGVASAAKNGLAFAGDKAANDSNRLAAAILEGRRDHSARQDEIYGPSRKDKANAMWANEKLRRGNNVKNFTDKAQNVIDDTFGLYTKRDDALRAMQAQEILGAPGNFYNYLGAHERAARATGGR